MQINATCTPKKVSVNNYTNILVKNIRNIRIEARRRILRVGVTSRSLKLAIGSHIEMGESTIRRWSSLHKF